jgi:hypothetical protein
MSFVSGNSRARSVSLPSQIPHRLTNLHPLANSSNWRNASLICEHLRSIPQQERIPWIKMNAPGLLMSEGLTSFGKICKAEDWTNQALEEALFDSGDPDVMLAIVLSNKEAFNEASPELRQSLKFIQSWLTAAPDPSKVALYIARNMNEEMRRNKELFNLLISNSMESGVFFDGTFSKDWNLYFEMLKSNPNPNGRLPENWPIDDENLALRLIASVGESVLDKLFERVLRQTSAHNWIIQHPTVIAQALRDTIATKRRASCVLSEYSYIKLSKMGVPAVLPSLIKLCQNSILNIVRSIWTISKEFRPRTF